MATPPIAIFKDITNFFHRRKKAVSSQTSELQALEARLKATEERLKKAGLSPAALTTSSSTNGRSSPSSNGGSSPRPRPGIGEDTFTATKAENGAISPLATEFRSVSRPQTKDGRAVEGAQPPTPGASEGESEPEPFDGEYVVVKNRRQEELFADSGQDGDAVTPAKQK
jgi:hypothetical protein